MFSLLIIMFLVVLFSGIFSTKMTVLEEQEETGERNYGVAQGSTELKRIDGTRVWLSHFSPSQLDQRFELDDWVINQATGCKAQKQLCGLQAMTERQGIAVIYTREAPGKLGHGAPWYGGYINPLNGSVYDLFGRAYKTNKGSIEALDVIIN